MKPVFLIAFLLLLRAKCLAGHITGGEMYYTFTGQSNGLYQYTVTLKLYKRCNISTAFPDPAIISVFNKTDNSRFTDIYAPLTRQENIRLNNNNPCIVNPPLVCFDVAYYTFTLSVPASRDGYILASQVNFRINGMQNLTPGYSAVGATYVAEIPGTSPNTTGIQNNSARFIGNDLVLVCSGNPFSYSFAATDPDGDQLRYTFCGAFRSTSQTGSAPPPDPPPYTILPYNTPSYSESMPMGNGITVNTNTGLLQGIAPAPGQYVVTVCVEETRRGAVIATQRKDIQINVADCQITSATLLPEYLLCGSSSNISITNLGGSPSVLSTIWDIRDAAGTLLYNYSGDTLTYSFADTGLYQVKLVINRNQSCADSTTSVIRVYPGFSPSYDFTGGCVTRPTQFRDLSTSVYGVPNSWRWDFGETAINTDTSDIKNPVYSYPSTGSKTARLIVTDTKGCRDTVEKSIVITTGPALSLAFRDTLICINDNLVLQATGTGNFSWSPPATLADPASPVTAATPAVTTTYYVNLEDGGCTNFDSVRVRVVNFVTLIARDTSICLGDTTQLNIISDGLQYNWSPAAQIVNPLVKNPVVITPVNTTFTVTATIGGCTETRTMTVTPVPYPVANAGSDKAVCYSIPIQLDGSTNGSSWNWSSPQFLDNPASITPLASPPRSTAFILYAYDTRGCPKPGTDTVLVTVIPKPLISAGNDTAVVVNEPLQLNATGGVSYQWSPSFNLSAANVANPVAVFSGPSAGLQYRVTGIDSAGCIASAYIMIKVFETGPTVFVPTAFTPNNDGLNDLLRPVGAGIKNIEFFSIYNRWGQLLFSTQQNGKGWDGRLNGTPQPAGTYVWQVKATDYTGKSYFRKGVVTLIR